MSFPLRGSVRGDFDHPKYQFKWFPITGKQEKCPDPTGEVKIFIQYVDTKAVGKPTDFQQVSHIGWDPDGGFDIKNIPQEWKSLFKKANIRKKDLEENPELQKQVLDIMNNAEDDARAHGTSINENLFVPPPPPPPIPGLSGGPPPPGGNKPGGLNKPPPPPVPGGDDDGGRGGGLLDQIRLGTSLKKVEVNENRESLQDGGTLLSTLQNALLLNRGAIEGDDDNDDWSNDWSEDED